MAFLDDIGINLKPPKAMGMATIKVGNDTDWQWLESVMEVEKLTGLTLLEEEDRALRAAELEAPNL